PVATGLVADRRRARRRRPPPDRARPPAARPILRRVGQWHRCAARAGWLASGLLPRRPGTRSALHLPSGGHDCADWPLPPGATSPGRRAGHFDGGGELRDLPGVRRSHGGPPRGLSARGLILARKPQPPGLSDRRAPALLHFDGILPLEG